MVLPSNFKKCRYTTHNKQPYGFMSNFLSKQLLCHKHCKMWMVAQLKTMFSLSHK